MIASIEVVVAGDIEPDAAHHEAFRNRLSETSLPT
jgi:hypothetical protein